MNKEKEIELIVLRHTKILRLIIGIMIGITFGFTMGYFMGVFDVISIYQIIDIKEALNLTQNVSNYVISEVSLN